MHAHNHDHSHSHRPPFDFPVATLAAGVWQRVAVLLPLIAVLWLGIAWALWTE